MSKNTIPGGLDSVLKQLGAFGTYNIVNYALLLFPVYLSGMFGSVFVFEATDIDYRCQVPECESTDNQSTWLNFTIPMDKDGKHSKCLRYSYIENITASNNSCTASSFNTSSYEPCSSIVYSDEDSAVVDFNLGCQEWKRTMIGTFHNSGLFISLPLTGIISDRYGRKVALSIASLMNCIFGLIRSFSTSYAMMVSFEFLEAALGAGAYTSAFVLAMELVGPKGRVFGNTIINVVFVCGLMSLSGLASALQSWRTLLRIIYTPAILVFSYLWLLNESVRWLLSKGRHDEAIAILKKAAKLNKVDLSEQDLAPLYELDIIKQDNSNSDKDNFIKDGKTEVQTTSTFKKIIKSKAIIKRLISCSFLWITCTFVYYGLTISSVNLGGNKYVNFILVAFIEIPANFACLLVLDRFGRKKVMVVMYLLSACMCIGMSFLPKNDSSWPLIFSLAGKFSITVAYSSVYIYVSEVFPTSARQSLLAICSSTGRLGSTLAPQTPFLNKLYPNLSALLFGGMAVTAGLLVLTLPETFNKPLPDTIEEAEELSRTSRERESA